MLDVEFALIFALVEKIMRYLDGIVRVVHGIFVFVYLTQQGTYLHMHFAFVLQHFEAQGWLLWVIEVLLQIVTLEMINAGLQANRAFL